MKDIKVLLIDDDNDDYILTKDVFTQLPSKYSLSWVNSFEKGLSAIRNKEFDVYLLDYQLGNGNGLQLLAEAINSGCREPIIMLTGKGGAAIDEQAMQIGAADYIIKDKLDPILLERSIRYSINHTGILEKLQSSELKYRTIFEQANDPFLVTDQSGIIIDLNPRGLKFFGYSPKEIISHNSQMLFKDSKDGATFLSLLERKGSLTEFECTLVGRNGQEFYCSLSAFIHTDMLTVTEVYHIMIKDLSYRRSLEAASINMGKLEVSEHIAKGLGEEMRDPLTTINLALHDIAEEEAIISNESAQASIEIIKSNCDRIDQLVRNLISSTDTKSLNIGKHSVRSLIEEAIEEAEGLIAGQHVQLTTQLPTTDDEIFVDKDKLKIALSNIIHNAIEAIEGFPKEIYITSSVENGILMINIEDNGTGIDSDKLSRIFEPFFSTKMRAVGLGLTHAHRILISHNGSIKVQPLAKGVLFTLQLPLKHEAQG